MKEANKVLSLFAIAVHLEITYRLAKKLNIVDRKPRIDFSSTRMDVRTSSYFPLITDIVFCQFCFKLLVFLKNYWNSNQTKTHNSDIHLTDKLTESDSEFQCCQLD